MFDSVLVANRGEIARRVLRTARALGLRTIAIYSEADAKALHVQEADEAVAIGGPKPADSYLDADAVLRAAEVTGAQAVHPGYGFLSERADFAQAVLDRGLVWVGPDPASIAAFGDKIAARNLMAAAGMPVPRGTTEPVWSVEEAVAAAAAVGYPLMVKPSGGGGGIGMRVAQDDADLRTAFEAARSQASRSFGTPAILLEQYLPGARHVEVQLLGLADGHVVALGERDCSVQRRYQKVVEETPSPGIDDALRARMLATAVAAVQRVGYRNAGTVECLVADGDFTFLEMNTRLQVEHPVTELVTGVDLVAAQLRIAAGEPPGFDPDAVVPHGHALELRVYAEDPRRFLPSPGTIRAWREPTGEGVRVDAGYGEGDTVTPHYDPLLAKLCVHGADRSQALERAARAVDAFVVEGPKTNLPFLAEVLADDGFRSGRYDTDFVTQHRSRIGQ